MNIYRITQEAVNNAMKYAEAKNILLNAKSVDHQVQITVTDDGRGFDIDETELGNGIRNMEKRASELNSTLSINSETGKGTRITLVIPKT
jgi:signal transduction histidine kinase